MYPRMPWELVGAHFGKHGGRIQTGQNSSYGWHISWSHDVRHKSHTDCSGIEHGPSR